MTDQSTDHRGARNYDEAFDVDSFRWIIRTYRESIEVRPSGWWQTATSRDFWDVFCMQVLVTQATRDGRELVYRDSAAWSRLSLETLGPFVRSHDQIGLREYLETELADNGMRMPVKKADTLSRAVFNPTIVSANQDFVLLTQVQHLWNRSRPVASIYRSELEARDIIKTTVFGFGDKSASDFLLEIGFADYLIALDVRVLSILRILGLSWLEQDSVQNDPIQYRRLQDFVFTICEREEITLRVVDRIFYQKKAEILAAF